MGLLDELCEQSLDQESKQKRKKSLVQCSKNNQSCKVSFYFQCRENAKKWQFTVWKFQDFSIIRILSEINLGGFSAIFGTLNFFHLVNFSFKK